MRNYIGMLAVLLSLPLISGCASLVKSDVTVFHQLQDIPGPTRYAFFPLGSQEGSLEHKTYMGLVRQHLAKHQYTEVSASEEPDVVIAFWYGIDDGKEKLSSVPIFGQTGVSSSSTYGTLNTYGTYGTYSGTTTYTPTYGIVGASTVSRTEFSRGLWLYIVEAKSVGTENPNVLYEGSVKSSGSSSQISRVMPAMVKALFSKFPGKSGKTRREIIPIQ